jgi:hypothetical protein
MKKILLLLVACGILLAMPAFAQTQGPEKLEITWSQLLGNPVLPVPDSRVPIEISTPADIQIWAHLVWPGQEGTTFTAEQVSLHYWIWREDEKSAKGQFIVSQEMQPNDEATVCEWFEWAEIFTDKPHCTYFKVQADLKIVGCEQPLVSNELTFHLVPEPGALGVLATSLAGIVAFGLRRRK